VFLKPVDRFVAGFMGVETLWRGRVVSCDEGMCTICTEAGILAEVIAEQPTGADVTVALRPEDVALSRATGASGEAQRTSVRNHWQGVVAAVTPSGPLVRVSVRLADGGGNETCFGGEGELVALVTRASAEELEIAPGVEVTASVKATALHVLGVSQQKGRLA
jgi:molybdopterin-binding protein